MLPPRLAHEIEEVRALSQVDVQEEEHFVNVILRDFPTGPDFSSPTTTVLLRVPRAYPDAGLDMFWTEPALTLTGGGVPRNAEALETYVGRPWRRFSWHHNGWNANIHNLHSYIEFVRRRFRER